MYLIAPYVVCKVDSAIAANHNSQHSQLFHIHFPSPDLIQIIPLHIPALYICCFFLLYRQNITETTGTE